MAALTSFQAKKCCRLVSEHMTSVRRLCGSVRQFLVYIAYLYLFENLIARKTTRKFVPHNVCEYLHYSARVVVVAALD